MKQAYLIPLSIVLLVSCNSEYLAGCGGDTVVVTLEPSPPANDAVCLPIGDEIFSRIASGECDSTIHPSEVGAAVLTGDLNGDGLEDLALGAPGCSRPGVAEHGAVFVCLGAEASAGDECGVPSTDNCIRVLDPNGIASGERFGSELAFMPPHPTEDAYPTWGWLLVGAPGHRTGDVEAGNVIAVEVDPNLTPPVRRWWESPGPSGFAAGDSPGYGSVLAVGNHIELDTDLLPSPELMVGAPNADLGGVVDTGLVEILIGDETVTLDPPILGTPHKVPAPFKIERKRIASRLQPAVCGGPCPGARFGHALEVGRFIETEERYLIDLAIGVPGGASGGLLGGRVLVSSGAGFAAGGTDWRGSFTDDQLAGALQLTQQSRGEDWTIPTFSPTGVADADPEAGDEFGYSLHATNLVRTLLSEVGGHYKDELIVGVPGEDLFPDSTNIHFQSGATPILDAGAACIVQFAEQDLLALEVEPEEDRFGRYRASRSSHRGPEHRSDTSGADCGLLQSNGHESDRPGAVGMYVGRDNPLPRDRARRGSPVWFIAPG